MAYSATVTKTKINEVDFVYEVTELEAVSGSEFTITVPTAGRILRYKCSATGVNTVDPVVAVATGTPGGVEVVMENATAATDIDLQASGYVLYYSSSKTLYIRNNSSTSQTLRTRIFLRNTWGL
tara:strand:- start:2018 stop:2389 length:372 start_codon:yes stop_codon:yes gene_type:complete